MRHLMMTTDTQINTYHKYINLPFTIAPLPNFNQQGDKVLHYYINDYPFYPMEEWFNDLGLTLLIKEVFYTPPGGKLSLIHI